MEEEVVVRAHFVVPLLMLMVLGETVVVFSGFGGFGAGEVDAETGG